MTDDHMDEHRCKAIAKGTGRRCRRFPVPGGTVCVKHGGGAPAVRAAAARRRAEAEATALLEVVWNENAEPVKDPVGALQKLAGQLQHAVNVLGARLHNGDELDHATGLLWSRVLGQLRLALEGMEKLDLAEKALELERDKATAVAYAFNTAIELATLPPELRARVVAAFIGALRSSEEPAVVAGEVAR